MPQTGAFDPVCNFLQLRRFDILPKWRWIADPLTDVKPACEHGAQRVSHGSTARAPMHRRHCLLTAPLLIVACATPPPKGRADLLDFLHDGRSTREDVYLKRGPRACEIETGRLVSWRLAKDEAGCLLVSSAAAGWLGARYELVVARFTFPSGRSAALVLSTRRTCREGVALRPSRRSQFSHVRP